MESHHTQATQVVGRYRKKQPKYTYDMEDIVLQPNTVPYAPLSLVAWEKGLDDDTTPKTAPRYYHTARTVEASERYRLVRKLCNTPFPFFRLPAELRLQIYGYFLICSKPIDFDADSDMMKMSDEDRPAMGLLRVCKRMYCEASQVFYGDSTFRFSEDGGHFSMLYVVPRNTFYWLKEITFCVPFDGAYPSMVPESDTQPRSAYPNHQFVAETPKHHYTPNQLLQKLLDLLVDTPYLHRMTLLIQAGSQPSTQGSYNILHSCVNDYIAFDIDLVFAVLKEFLTMKYSLEVSVTRLYYEGENDYATCQAKCIKNLKRELGIWDHREQEKRKPCTPSDWRLNAKRTEEDPKDFLLYVRNLYL